MEIAIGSFAIFATILCGILSIVLYHVRRLPLYHAAARLPGPSTMPLIGNAWFFAGNPDDLLTKFMAISKLYSTPQRYWLGNHLAIILDRIEHIQTILNNSNAMNKPYYYKCLEPAFGKGLLTAPASMWRLHRRLISPTFNTRTLKSFVSIFARQSKILVQQMRTELNGQEFEIHPYLYSCTLDFIYETAMGIHSNAQTEEHSTFLKGIARLMQTTFERIFKIWLHPDTIFRRTQAGKDQLDFITHLNTITSDLIRKKEIELAEKSARSDTVMDDQLRKKCFLDLLMELTKEGSRFSDAELRDEVNTMLMAGSETNATTLSFVILMLASHPEVQDEVYEELCGIYGEDDDDRDVTDEDLSRMDYTERVIKETMRILPTVPIVARHISEDIEIDGYTLPKGCSVGLYTLGLHRNEEYWPDPLKFDPDRFLPEEKAKRHPYCYLPFSGGPRNCIGLNYAMMSMKTLLATFLRRYTVKKDIITPIKDMELKVDIVLKPIRPIKIRIETRTTKHK